MPLDINSARNDFKRIVRELCASYECPDVLEVGGGARPLFAREAWPTNLRSYTINDVSQLELDKAPPYFAKACFDICDPKEELAGRFDVIFSKHVAEHVSDGERMHRNVYDMLRPGGVAFHFFPTLYSLPMLVNWLIPEGLSRASLFLMRPGRREANSKFPALYSWCAGSNNTIREQIKSVGFSNVQVVRFYDHDYLKRFAVLRSVEKAWVDVVKRSGITQLGSCAYVIARR
jgi:2-polyprenyl-3-methyl-5-hydroxy-6-metoxy-1,4-benzoquinol methylase